MPIVSHRGSANSAFAASGASRTADSNFVVAHGQLTSVLGIVASWQAPVTAGDVSACLPASGSAGLSACASSKSCRLAKVCASTASFSFACCKTAAVSWAEQKSQWQQVHSLLVLYLHLHAQTVYSQAQLDQVSKTGMHITSSPHQQISVQKRYVTC